MPEEDFVSIQNALMGAVLAAYPASYGSDAERVYAFDQSLLMTAEKWITITSAGDVNGDMMRAFVEGSKKLVESGQLSELLIKLPESHLGDQILIATYFKHKVYTEDISLDEVWNTLQDAHWREAAFRKSHLMVLESLFDALNEIETRYQDKWSYNLPHYYALECEKCEDKERKEYLFACVIHASVCGSTVSGIQRLLKSEFKHSYQDYVNHWRVRLKADHRQAPEWVKARIRPVLAALRI